MFSANFNTQTPGFFGKFIPELAISPSLCPEILVLKSDPAGIHQFDNDAAAAVMRSNSAAVAAAAGTADPLVLSPAPGQDNQGNGPRDDHGGGGFAAACLRLIDTYATAKGQPGFALTAEDIFHLIRGE